MNSLNIVDFAVDKIATDPNEEVITFCMNKLHEDAIMYAVNDVIVNITAEKNKYRYMKLYKEHGEEMWELPEYKKYIAELHKLTEDIYNEIKPALYEHVYNKIWTTNRDITTQNANDKKTIIKNIIIDLEPDVLHYMQENSKIYKKYMSEEKPVKIRNKRIYPKPTKVRSASAKPVCVKIGTAKTNASYTNTGKPEIRRSGVVSI